MALTLTFDQSGLPAGELDRGRTDIRSDTAAEGERPTVTITVGSIPAGSRVIVQLIDEPPSANPLLTEVSQALWTLAFDAACWGPFRVRAVATLDAAIVSSVTRRISIRSPLLALDYPALAERSDPNARSVATPASVELTEMNEASSNRPLVDFHRSIVEVLEGDRVRTRSVGIDRLESSPGIIVENPDGPLATVSLDFGTGEGQVATASHVEALRAELAAHKADTANPHILSQPQIGLASVANAAQIKADFASYTPKPALVGGDVLSLGNSASGNAISRATLAQILALAPAGGGAPPPAGTSYPFARVPAAALAFNDEFEGGSPDLTARGWRLTWNGTTMSRRGPVLPMFNQTGGSTPSDINVNEYRSSIVGSVLFIQVQQTNALEIAMFKGIATGSATWPNGLMGTARVGGMGWQTPAPGTEHTAGFFVGPVWPASGGADMVNKMEASTRTANASNNSITEAFHVVAGARTTVATATEPGHYETHNDVVGLYAQPATSGSTTQTRYTPFFFDTAKLAGYAAAGGVANFNWIQLTQAGIRIHTGSNVAPDQGMFHFAIDFIRIYIGDISQKLPANA